MQNPKGAGPRFVTKILARIEIEKERETPSFSKDVDDLVGWADFNAGKV
jgi:hypothetical protein